MPRRFITVKFSSPKFFIPIKYCHTQQYHLEDAFLVDGVLEFVSNMRYKNSLHSIKRSVESTLPVHVLPVFPLHHLVHCSCCVACSVPRNRLKNIKITSGSATVFLTHLSLCGIESREAHHLHHGDLLLRFAVHFCQVDNRHGSLRGVLLLLSLLLRLRS